MSIHEGQTHAPTVLTRRNNKQNACCRRLVRPHSLFRNNDNYTFCSLSDGNADATFLHRLTDKQTAGLRIKGLWWKIKIYPAEKNTYFVTMRTGMNCLGQNKFSVMMKLKITLFDFVWSRFTNPVYFMCNTTMRTNFVLVYCTMLSVTEGYVTNKWMAVNNDSKRYEGNNS